jgi:transposase-like protein
MTRHNRRGRRPKLTPEVEATILRAVRNGFTLASAARLAGISRWTLFYWLRELSHFSHAVRAAQQEAAQVRIKANPRPLSRARYEHDATPAEMRVLLYKETMRTVKEGRVPYEVAIEALKMAVDELEDSMAEESLSFADDIAHGRVHGGRRSLAG